MPAQFIWMVWAELRKVYTRGSGLGAIIVAGLVGFVAVGAMWEVRGWQDGASMNGVPVSQMVSFSGISAAGWALQLRNFFVLPMLLLLATASAVAGEYSERTLRELTVRPVSRWSILAAKAIALSILSLTTLVLSLAPPLVIGTGVFGLSAEGGPAIQNLLGGYAASFLSDLGLITIGMLASLFVSSVGGVVVTVVLVLMADRGIWLVLQAAKMFKVQAAESLVQWTLVNALGCWEGWKDGWVPAQFAALALIIVVTASASVLRFSRMDVP